VTSNLLLVDDDPAMVQLMHRMLSGLGQLRFATSGAAALRRVREQLPDLVLLDADMPGMSGYQVCEAMKADPALRDIPIIFVTAYGDDQLQVKGLEIGAVDFITKPISEPLLLARVRTQLRVKHLTDELRRIATIDALTEVSNRRTFDETLAREWRRGLRGLSPLSLVLVDVDHFKLFNDRYGHPAGDACLRAVAQALRNTCRRPADLVARFGGEEFALLLPHTQRAGAESLALRLLAEVEGLGIPHEDSPTAELVTVSIGLSCHDPRDLGAESSSSMSGADPATVHTEQALVRSADQALYRAKQGGRAQAWRLDLEDVDTVCRAIAVEDSSRTLRAHADQ